MKISVLYEDNHLLVVEKPQNIPVQGDVSGDEDFLNMLKADIKVRHAKLGNVFLGLVHRLDRPVGGVMVFAKTTKAASRLSEQIRTALTAKEYLAVVTGLPNSGVVILEDYLIKDNETNIVRIAGAGETGAKKAMLEYELIESLDNLSLLKINLITGRPHQIRVQLANAGVAITGDAKYGVTKGKTENLALWSHRLTFIHPVSKEKISFVSKPPEQKPWSLFSSVFL